MSGYKKNFAKLVSVVADKNRRQLGLVRWNGKVLGSLSKPLALLVRGCGQCQSSLQYR